MTTRTAALLYTSADAEGARGGGFKVTSSRGDLEEGELDELARYRPVAGGLDDEPLPQFATPEQVAAGPRALDYRAALDGVAWWHVAPAGSDATGRGSNQVMHVAFASGPLRHRPVELWRSSDWMTPFGSDQVAAASLGSALLPTAQAGLSREAVLDGLAGGRADALETLLVVVDVVVRALETGELVLLAVDDADDAAWWVAAVTHLLPLASAQRVTFSIPADASQGAGPLIQVLRDDAILLGCVVRSSLNLDEVPADVVLVDTAAPVVLGLGGEDHQVGARRVVATEMSALALELLVDPDLAGAAMDWVDQTLAPAVEPRWALAASLLRDPERYADAAAGAARLLVMHAPPAVPAELAEVGRQALDVLVSNRDAEQLWALYAQLAPTNAFRPSVALAYVRRALVEPSWLNRSVVPAPDGPLEVPDGRELLEGLADRSRADAGAVPQLAVLNAVALLAEVGAVRPQAPATVEDHAALELLADIVRPLIAVDVSSPAWDLLHDAPAPVVLRRTLATLAVELVQADAAVSACPLGERLDERVTTWLLPDLRDVLATPDLEDQLVAERLVRASPTFPPRSVELAHAFEAAVLDRERGGARAAVLDRFGELDAPVAASILMRRSLYRRHWLTDRAYVTFLLTAPWDTTVETLCRGIEGRTVSVVRDAAFLRLRSRQRLWLQGDPSVELVSTVTTVLRSAPTIVSAADQQLLALLQAVHCWAEIGWAGRSLEIGTDGAMMQVLDSRTSIAVQDELVRVCGAVPVLVAYLSALWHIPPTPRIGIVVQGDDGEQPMLEVLARRTLAEADDLSALIASVQARFRPRIAGAAVDEALQQLAPRGARLAQGGQKLVEGVRGLFGRQRSEYEEKS
ncbi:hypothetical protein C8046_11690 [Serinibacter arcticus]|uniref:Uncharacterized protein n=1 Tax=Serinibacter arcticus TaxID=1655435 RepID=A0A2U1ZW49_9MICO|nr:hypothetical protein [Serinibacter arcticus]PWD51215.1 hypothetical protein C8046_11690 [Serinibacter arcticus]